MSGVFPHNGVTTLAASGSLTIPAEDLANGCEAMWYATSCSTRFDPVAQNAMISEIVAIATLLNEGDTYDCTKVTNARDAIEAKIAGLSGGSDRAFLAVIDELNAPPPAPSEGDTYAVGAGPTGAWSGKAGSIARYGNGGWSFIPAYPFRQVAHGSTEGRQWKEWTGTAWEPVSLFGADTDTVIYNDVYPTILTVDHKATVTSPTVGVVNVDAFKWKWRSELTLDSQPQSFNTAANRTYHLRVDYDHVSGNPPVMTLADRTGVPEANSQYDADYDSLLLARIVTNGSNVPTITVLQNAAVLVARGEKTTMSVSSTTSAWGIRGPYVANFCRTPDPRFLEWSFDGTTGVDSAVKVQHTAVSRYQWSAIANGYGDILGTLVYVGGTFKTEARA